LATLFDTFAIVPDREDQTGGHSWPHFSAPLRSSLIAKIKWAAIPGRTFQNGASRHGNTRDESRR
jgi:hypothetical protein